MNSTVIASMTKADPDRQSMIAWEAIMGLKRLHGAAKIHKEPAREQRRILRVAGELLGTRSLAWVPTQRDDEVVFEGDRLLSPWDCAQLVGILAVQPGWEESGYVLINDARENRWGPRFPRVLNLLAVPVAEKTLAGWMLAFNKGRFTTRRPGGREPRSPRARGRMGRDRSPMRSCHSAARTRPSSCRSPRSWASTCGLRRAIST